MARPLNEVTWVDLGGGTAENVAMMDKYIPIKSFKKVYVVDLCASLCRVAEKKCADKGWTNVEVVEGDACTFKPAEGKVTLVTFSYSLSMIPPFIAAIDNGIEMLQDDGIFGIADFYVSRSTARNKQQDYGKRLSSLDSRLWASLSHLTIRAYSATLDRMANA